MGAPPPSPEEALSLVEALVVVLLEDHEVFRGDAAARRSISVTTIVWMVREQLFAGWSEEPRARRRIEEAAHERIVRAIDALWIERAIAAPRGREMTLLVRRIDGLFTWALRRRGLRGDEAADARQDFLEWLVRPGAAGDFAQLRRWSPEKGRSLDSWFRARALHQIASYCRRQRPGSEDLQGIELADEGGRAGSSELQVAVREHLASIQRWLLERGSELQREVFRRWFVEEECAAEIAVALKITPEYVHVIASRLRRSLKALHDL